MDVGAALVQMILPKSNAVWGDALHVKHIVRYTTTYIRDPAVFLRIRIQAVRE